MDNAPIRFGTDGWRGVIADTYTFHNVRRAAQGFATFVRRTWPWDKGLVIGYDRRFGSDRFAQTAAEVLAGNSIPVHLVDRACPTPVAAFTIAELGAAGAAIITASHNPPSDNGLKVRTATGAAVDPERLTQIEREVAAVAPGSIRRLDYQVAVEAGLIRVFNPDAAYLTHVRDLVDLTALRASPRHIVFDAMYGAGAGWLERLLGGGRLRITPLHAEWNPGFPGMSRPEPIPPQTDMLARAVVSAGASVGLATDGDADRLGVVDERGVFVDQLRTIALLAYYFLEHRQLRKPLVRTLTSSHMLDALGKRYGVEVAETAVGMKYVAPKMRELDAAMGGEESGGYVFGPHMPERDGLVAALYFLDLMAREDKTPAQLVTQLFRTLGREYHYRRDDLTFPADQRTTIEQRVRAWTPSRIDGGAVVRRNTEDGYKYYLDDESWLLIRFSGTEPLLRIYCETTSAARVATLLRIGRATAGLA
ncbi:MAG: phosphoglucomutase/phosphomannomutase family protein [Actinobacteria bacterium]|nr:phosphoglucomutase/phosphomannomutase family protein [Actinomycetota bacterium]